MEFSAKVSDMASQTSFGTLKLWIWILFDICFLVLGIFYIQRLNYNIAVRFDY
jgi:hypothetical protein